MPCAMTAETAEQHRSLRGQGKVTLRITARISPSNLETTEGLTLSRLLNGKMHIIFFGGNTTRHLCDSACDNLG